MCFTISEFLKCGGEGSVAKADEMLAEKKGIIR